MTDDPGATGPDANGLGASDPAASDPAAKDSGPAGGSAYRYPAYQGVPVGTGQATLRIAEMTVGGTG